MVNTHFMNTSSSKYELIFSKLIEFIKLIYPSINHRQPFIFNDIQYLFLTMQKMTFNPDQLYSEMIAYD